MLAYVKLGPKGQANDIVKQMVDVLLPQLYRAADLGYIDINRLALSGQSFGGTTTAAIVSQTNLFRAAIPVNGSFDLGSAYGDMSNDGHSINAEWAETDQGRMGNHVWADPLHYIENSPYYRADKIFTPLLIIAGEEDSRVAVEESEKLFAALRRLERPAQLAIYEGEDHVISYWSTVNAIDVSKRMIEFLKKHIGPGWTPEADVQ